MDKLKNKKSLVIIAVIIVLIGGAYYWHRHSAKKIAPIKAKTTQSGQVSDKSLTGKKAAKLGTNPDTTQVNSDTSTVPSNPTQTNNPSGSINVK